MWPAWVGQASSPGALLPPVHRSPGSRRHPLLTQGDVPGLLPLYVPEEIPLRRGQGPPFFPGEIEGNVSKCHRSLERGEKTWLRTAAQDSPGGRGVGMGTMAGPGKTRMERGGLDEKTRFVLGTRQHRGPQRGRGDEQLTWTTEAKPGSVFSRLLPSLRAGSWAEGKERRLREASAGREPDLTRARTHTLSEAPRNGEPSCYPQGDTRQGARPLPSRLWPTSLLTAAAGLLPEWPASGPHLHGKPLGGGSLAQGLGFRLL